MAKQAIAGLVVVGLAIGVWLLWPRGDPESPTTGTPSEAAGSTTTTEVPTTVTIATATTTTEPDSHIVETVEEAEAILRELWFGWFEGIYNQDEDRIREVVATEQYLQAGIDAFDTLQFVSVPHETSIAFEETELLTATEECLAVWTVSDALFLSPGPDRIGVDVMRWTSDGWKLLSSWRHKNDLWENDCDVRLGASS